MKKVTFDGTPIVSSGGKRAIQLDTLTGNQFKTLIEQITKDGKINTIPELIAFVGDVPEGSNLLDYIQAHSVDPEVVEKAVDEKFEEEQCSDEDIDSIFDEDDEPEPESENAGDENNNNN